MTNILYKYRAFIDTVLFKDKKPQEEYTLLGTIAITLFFPMVLLIAISIRLIDFGEYIAEIKIKPKKKVKQK